MLQCDMRILAGEEEEPTDLGIPFMGVAKLSITPPPPPPPMFLFSIYHRSPVTHPEKGGGGGHIRKSNLACGEKCPYS